MPDEFDAFGRKKDDAGLGDLGWGTTEAPAEAPRESQAVAAPRDRGRTRPRLGGFALSWVIALIVLGGVGLAVFSAGNSAVDSARTTLDGFKKLTPGVPAEEGDDDVPTQVRADSFFTAKGLRAGLRILAKEQPGRITNFSFRKDRINLQINRGRKSHNVQLSAGAEAPEEFTVTTATSSSINTLSYEEINPGAAPRLLSAANARLNASTRQADYFVVSKTLGPVQWGVYYKNGKIALGDSRGRFTRRIS